ncbi:MAG: peptidylprolyl isomerase [Pseudomonadota bacterium]
MSLLLKTVIAVLISCSTTFAADTLQAATAALVNGAVISTADYRGELARVLRMRKKTEADLDSATLAMTKKEALETLVGRELLYQQSIKDGISIPDAEVDAEISKLRSQFPSEDDFNASLGKLNLSREAVMSQIKRGMAIQALTDSRFGAKTAVAESETRGYYDSHRREYLQPARVRLSHILIKFDTLAGNPEKTKARARIENLHRRVLQGEDFALLAVESDDSVSGANGGDLGYFTPGQLGKNMEAAAFSLGVGQVSAIVEDRFGYHILKVTGRSPEEALPFEEVREKISKQLRRERLQAEVVSYLKRLREAARVEIHLAGE